MFNVLKLKFGLIVFFLPTKFMLLRINLWRKMFDKIGSSLW